MLVLNHLIKKESKKEKETEETKTEIFQNVTSIKEVVTILFQFIQINSSIFPNKNVIFF